MAHNETSEKKAPPKKKNFMSWLDDVNENPIMKNMGGLGNALFSSGSQIIAMVAGMTGRDGSFARGALMGSQAHERAMSQGRKDFQSRLQRKWAASKAEEFEEGSRQREYYEAIASGNRAQASLLPSKWNAELADAKRLSAGGPSKTDIAYNRTIDRDRQILAEINADSSASQRLMNQMGAENISTLINNARKAKKGVADPDHAQWHRMAVTSPMAGLLHLELGDSSPPDSFRAEFEARSPSDSATGASRTAQEESESENSPWIPDFVEKPARRFFGIGKGEETPSGASSPEGLLSAELSDVLGSSGELEAEVPALAPRPRGQSPRSPSAASPRNERSERDVGRRQRTVEEMSVIRRNETVAGLLRAAGLVPAEETQIDTNVAHPTPDSRSVRTGPGPLGRGLMAARDRFSTGPLSQDISEVRGELSSMGKSLMDLLSDEEIDTEQSVTDPYAIGVKARRAFHRGLIGR